MLTSGVRDLRKSLLKAGIAAIAIVLAIVPASTARAAAGDPDFTFGGGSVIFNLSNNGGIGSADLANALAIQSDGNIIAAGSWADHNGGKTNFALVRYDTFGSPDFSFGANLNGVVTTTVSSANDSIHAIALQKDGNIVVAGNSGSNLALARYVSATGLLDPSFGTGGIVTSSLGGGLTGEGVTIQSDGKIVVAGSSSSRFAVLRYNSNGALDHTFNSIGSNTTAIGAVATAQAVAIQPDGKIVVAGFADTGVTDDFAVARYTTGGLLDATFHGTGTLTTDIQGGTDQAHAVAVQPDGKILVTGDTSSGSSRIATLRYTSNGNLDSSFGVSGTALTRPLTGTTSVGRGVAVQLTGDVVAAGHALNGAGNDFVVIRYLSNGTLDPNFNISGTVPGVVQTHLFNPSDSMANAVAIQTDNKIVVAGSTDLGTNNSTDFALVRYESPFVPPVVTSFDKTVLENHILSFSSSDFLTHYNDPQSAIMSKVQITSLPLAGTLNISGTPVTLLQEIPTGGLGGLTYTPDPGTYGNDSFTWNASNGLTYALLDASVNITVTYVNQAPSFTKGSDQTVLENSGTQTVTAWATNISAGPLSEFWQVVTFTASTNNNALFSSLPVIISTTGDLSYTPAPNVYGSAVVTVTLKDSGGTANGGVDTSIAQTFHITVTFVNQAPSFTKGSDQTVLENAGPQTVTAWATNILAGPPNESSQVLTFTTSTNNNALFSALPAVNTNTGNLTFTPAPNIYGSSLVTVTLKDSGGIANGGVDTSIPQTFTITVGYVNQAPSFTKGPDQSVQIGTGVQVVHGWASNVLAGPPSESWQVVTFTLVTSKDSLFAALPVIDFSGNLTYTPSLHVWGTAMVTVTLKDNGGSANGGIDTSAPQVFAITVKPFVAFAPIVRRN